MTGPTAPLSLSQLSILISGLGGSDYVVPCMALAWVVFWNDFDSTREGSGEMIATRNRSVFLLWGSERTVQCQELPVKRARRVRLKNIEFVELLSSGNRGR